LASGIDFSKNLLSDSNTFLKGGNKFPPYFPQFLADLFEVLAPARFPRNALSAWDFRENQYSESLTYFKGTTVILPYFLQFLFMFG
jgi:hypothetical protein